jgi:hypothetical protein
LLLLAAAHETGLIRVLSDAIPLDQATIPTWLQRMLRPTLQALLLTLLFLGVVGLRRLWELRSYTGTALGLLTGRLWAYGYRFVERFLAILARTETGERLTAGVARWATQLWHGAQHTPRPDPMLVYIDGHKKPVYCDKRIPRGLIGRTGDVRGCRTLVLLHDAQGHPLLATTARGDQHLTSGLPAIVRRYEAVLGATTVGCIVVDREGMGGDFLASLVDASRTVITLLRTDQYAGEESFTDVGTFEPLAYDQHGKVIREVAPARFALAVPKEPGRTLSLHVALIRDWRQQEPAPLQADDDLDAPEWVPPHERWLADLPLDERAWWRDGWMATPAPPIPTRAKLIPIVSTADLGPPKALVAVYTARWPLQENVIKDWLIPLGLDVKHGYGKWEVDHSEVVKQRAELEQRRDRLQQWADSARKRLHNAETRYARYHKLHRTRGDALYGALNAHQETLRQQGVSQDLRKREIDAMRRLADAELNEIRTKVLGAQDQCHQEQRKLERYCQEQRKVLRVLEDLNAESTKMYELDNRTDHMMTMLKVALVNLVLWVRDRFFPAAYAHATWKRLAPFFHLAGRIHWGREEVEVELCPFNDRQLNRDLVGLCERVTTNRPRLPDGRRLVFSVCSDRTRTLERYRRC